MPRDANGVYTLPDGYLAQTGATIQSSQHNPPLEDLAAAMTGSLPRSGGAPMTGPLKIQDGSAIEPSLSFASDPSIGFFKNGAFIGASKPITGVLPIGLGPLPWSRVTAPAGWVFCTGQTLSRTAYPDLWVVAQAEIAANSTLYNNGNGSTTFGIMDMIGRVPVCVDFVPQRITGFQALGSVGGVGSVALDISQIPSHSHANTATVNDPGHSHQFPYTAATPPAGGTPLNGVAGGASGQVNVSPSFTGITVTMNNASIGGGAGHTNMQPSIATQYILYAGA